MSRPIHHTCKERIERKALLVNHVKAVQQAGQKITLTDLRSWFASTLGSTPRKFQEYLTELRGEGKLMMDMTGCIQPVAEEPSSPTVEEGSCGGEGG